MAHELYKPDVLTDYAPLVYGEIPDHKPGTVAYDEYWEEIDSYVLNGYKPTGLRKITSKHFYYNNVWKIKLNPPGQSQSESRKILGTPWYRDMDHVYFDLIQASKDDQHGMIVLKARDKGFSMMNAGATGHEYTMYPQNEVGIAAGLSVTADSFFTKVRSGLDDAIEPYEHGILLDNQSKRVSGYKIKNPSGGWKDGGYQSIIHVRTMNNPNVFKGERLSLMIFEEAGEFTNLIEGYIASKACFMDGDKQFGVPIIGGTGGDIEKSSKDFKTMWYDTESYNLKKLFIPASYVYSGFFDLKTGVSQIESAEEKIKEDRRKIKGSAYFLHIQNYPLTAEEAFIKTKNGALDLAKINKQIARLKDSDWADGLIEHGELEWVYPSGFKPNRRKKKRLQSIVESGATVRWVPKKDGIIKIYKHPEPTIKNLDLGGVDSIDQDDTGVKSSDGSVVIYRKFINLSKEYNLPIAILKFRSDDADEFFEYVIKLAMYYKAKMLVEHTKIEVAKLMERFGLQEYLHLRPETAYDQLDSSSTRNKFGVHMFGAIKNYMITLMKHEVKENIEQIYFLDLLYELADFGTRNTDIAMAYGIALLGADDGSIHETEWRDDNKREIGGANFGDDNGFGEWQSKTAGYNGTSNLDWHDTRDYKEHIEQLDEWGIG